MNDYRSIRERLMDWAVAGFVIWFGSYVYLYTFEVGGPKPLYSYLAFLAACMAYLGFRYQARKPLIDQRSDAGVLWKLFAWLCAYLAYGIFEFLNSPQGPVARQALTTQGESIALVAGFALAMAHPVRVRRLSMVFAALAVIGTVINVYDFVHPNFSNVPGRAAGFYVNPNIAGHFLAMAMVAGIATVPRRVRLPYMVLCGMGVLVTFSRAAWILWDLGILSFGWEDVLTRTRSRRRFGVALRLLLAVGAAGLQFSGAIGYAATKTGLQTYLTPNTAARLGIGKSELSGNAAGLVLSGNAAGLVLSGNAAADRKRLVLDGLKDSFSDFFIGHGLGHTREWRYDYGPHDMYILFLVDGGILGLAMYLLLMAVIWHCSSGVTSILAVQIMAASFFTHNLLEQPAFLLLVGFIIAYGAVRRAREDRGKAVPTGGASV